MGALNIRDLGDERKAALTAEAKARGLSVSELARRFIDEGIDRAQAERAREAWVAEAREGFVHEAEHLAAHGASLARYRWIRAGL
ncbi:type II toxin-antitoxin system CcdA family antitoxin [Amaricoccus sp. W119]|uniref:type II toxin-antitoxin system CcdA family antitoxin n=1 Tax=Amaricoccus sp. W119 TaxID=3391833 RepID=UPI0039A5DCD9